MTDDGTLTDSWDRAGQLLDAGSSAYEYNGLGNRLSQTVSAVVTEYLLDVQPGLSKVLAATTGANVDRFVHTPQGIQAIQNNASDWLYTLQDGLGSVRAVVDESFDVLHSQHYAPYGEPFGENGTSQTDFGFTGESTDGNGLVHLRARYLNPSLGVFPSLDPKDCNWAQPMSLNKYSYVVGNVVNLVDPSGMFGETPPSDCGSFAHDTSAERCIALAASQTSGIPQPRSFSSRGGTDGIGRAYPIEIWSHTNPDISSHRCLTSGQQIQTEHPIHIMVKPQMQSWYRGSTFLGHDNTFRRIFTLSRNSVTHVTETAIYTYSEQYNGSFVWRIPIGSSHFSFGEGCRFDAHSNTDARATFQEGDLSLSVQLPTRRCAVPDFGGHEVSTTLDELRNMSYGETANILGAPVPLEVDDCSSEQVLERIFQFGSGISAFGECIGMSQVVADARNYACLSPADLDLLEEVVKRRCRLGYLSFFLGLPMFASVITSVLGFFNVDSCELRARLERIDEGLESCEPGIPA